MLHKMTNTICQGLSVLNKDGICVSTNSCMNIMVLVTSHKGVSWQDKMAASDKAINSLFYAVLLRLSHVI